MSLVKWVHPAHLEDPEKGKISDKAISVIPLADLRCHLCASCKAVEIGRANATQFADREAQLQATLAKREEELEAYAWTISPAMAQAKIDGQNQHIQELQATLAAREARIRELEGELHTVKTQCGENAISYMLADQEARRLQERLLFMESGGRGRRHEAL